MRESCARVCACAYVSMSFAKFKRMPNRARSIWIIFAGLFTHFSARTRGLSVKSRCFVFAMQIAHTLFAQPNVRFSTGDRCACTHIFVRILLCCTFCGVLPFTKRLTSIRAPPFVTHTAHIVAANALGGGRCAYAHDETFYIKRR